MAKFDPSPPSEVEAEEREQRQRAFVRSMATLEKLADLLDLPVQAFFEPSPDENGEVEPSA